MGWRGQGEQNGADGNPCGSRGCRDGERGFPGFGVGPTERGLADGLRFLTRLPGREVEVIETGHGWRQVIRGDCMSSAGCLGPWDVQEAM